MMCVSSAPGRSAIRVPFVCTPHPARYPMTRGAVAGAGGGVGAREPPPHAGSRKAASAAVMVVVRGLTGPSTGRSAIPRLRRCAAPLGMTRSLRARVEHEIIVCRARDLGDGALLHLRRAGGLLDENSERKMAGAVRQLDDPDVVGDAKAERTGLVPYDDVRRQEALDAVLARLTTT